MLLGINHLTVTVHDLRRSLQFYSELLCFTPLVRWRQGAYLQNQELWLCLNVGRPQPAQDYSHIALTVEPNRFCELQQRLTAADVCFWQENSSEGSSLYFLDPDGHKLEAHVGDLGSRLAAIAQKPYEQLHWYPQGLAVIKGYD